MCATFLPVCLCISVSLCPCVSVFVFLSVAPCVCLSLFVFMLLRVGSTFSNGEPWPSTDCRFYLPPSANVPVTPALHGAQSATNYDQEKKTCAISGCSLSWKHLSIQQVTEHWFVCSQSLVPAFCKCMPGACSQLLRSIISLETDYCGEPPRLGAVAAQHNPALISN